MLGARRANIPSLFQVNLFCFMLDNCPCRHFSFSFSFRFVKPLMDHENTFPVMFAMQDDGVDEVDICALCSQKHPTTLCGACNENDFVEYIGPHTCGLCTLPYRGRSSKPEATQIQV